MSYYKTQKRVNIEINERYQELALGKIETINVARLILFLTNEYETSQLYIRKRIDLLLSVDKNLKLEGDVLKYER